MSCVGWFLDDDMKIIWWGECGGECFYDDNLSLWPSVYVGRVSYDLWEGFCWNEYSIFGRVSFMLELHLTKATRGSNLVRYLPKYHPWALTLNGLFEWWELLPKRFSNFSMYMGWIVVYGETWILVTNHEWEGWKWKLLEVGSLKFKIVIKKLIFFFGIEIIVHS